MINLIRNELTKIFSKKAIYIYSIIVFAMLIVGSVISKKIDTEDTSGNNYYIESLEEGLNDYDLTNNQQIELYIGDRTLIDSNKISSKYNFYTPEYYYVNEYIQPLIREKYELEYSTKDAAGAAALQTKIDEEIKKLDNFDWKAAVLDKKKDVIDDIKYYEEALLLDKENESIKLALDTLKIELWCLDYRLEKEVPYSYAVKSNFVDTYYDYSVQYLSAIKDESLIKDKNELRRNRETIANYEVAKYRIEHDMIEDDHMMIEFIIESMAYVDGLIIVVIIIISGSIISEEFNKGTIKQLLTKPFGRCKILTSKIIASLLAILIFVMLYETVFILANCYEYSNFTGIFGNTVVYDYSLGKVREISVLGQALTGFLSVVPAYLIIYAVVLFVGALSTSSVASMCAGFGVFFFGDLVSIWLNEKIMSFMPFFTWNLSPYLYGGMSSNNYASFGKSLFIDICTFIVLMVLAYVIFKRKDIKNQ